jgi:hypothetical protein
MPAVKTNIILVANGSKSYYEKVPAHINDPNPITLYIEIADSIMITCRGNSRSNCKDKLLAHLPDIVKHFERLTKYEPDE